MTTDFKSIPVIDVGPLVAKADELEMGQDPDVREVVKKLDQACRETGFFYVKGHGIPESLMTEVKDVSHKFFDLPCNEKLKIKMTPASGFRGYQEIRENITNGVPDLQEAVDYYREVKKGTYGSLGEVFEGCNQWPEEPPNFKALIEEYIKLCTDLSRKIMRGIALALGVSVNEFEGERAGLPFWVFRLLGYPGISAESGLTNDTGCGVHTDYGLLTLVNQDDDITALEVRNLAGEWIRATPIPGTFVCNIGDMLKIWTNGMYEATLHRVINNSSKYRVSITYFYEPNFDMLVEPLEICVEKSGRSKLNARAIYGEYLVNKVRKTYGM